MTSPGKARFLDHWIGRRQALAGLGSMAVMSCATPPLVAPHPILDLSDLERRYGGSLGIAAFNSDRAHYVWWRGHERFAYCSTFKLFLAAATLQRVDRGEERLDRPIAVAQADMRSHAPVTGRAVGSTLTVGELAQAAVEVSDNPAANLLIRELGGLDAWRRWYANHGDRVTRVDRWETDLNRVRPGDLRDTTTPLQTVENLNGLFGRPRLTIGSEDLLVKWLVDSPVGANRIKAALPPGPAVAHKTGSSDDGRHTNDIGFIGPPGSRGRPTYIAAYYTGSSLPLLEDREAVLAAGVQAALRALGKL